MRSELTNWLLSTDNPSVRYHALRDIEGKEEHSAVVRASRLKIRYSKIVNKIFERQEPQGYWEDIDSPYLPKYKASYWQVMLLGQLGMDNRDKRIQKACRYIFSFQHAEGGFTCETERTALREYMWYRQRGRVMPKKNEWVTRKLREGQLSCLTGNIAAALIRLGYRDDRRVERALSWLCEVQNSDGGWLCPYWSAHVMDRHGCFYGTISPLEAMSEIPRRSRTRAMRKALDRGAEFMLMHSLFRADHHDRRVINQTWLRFSFPRFSGYDILRGMDVLTKLGFVDDERVRDAVGIIEKKRMPNGAWVLDGSPTGRMHANIETVGKSSKWITLIALRVLKRLGCYP
jgi:hypothetical protein